MSEQRLSAEARAILSVPFPARIALLAMASEQAKAEVTIECARILNERFPEMNGLTDALAAVAVEGSENDCDCIKCDLKRKGLWK